jgi:hypothetical protein
MERFGLGNRWAFRAESGRFYGLSEPAVAEVLSTADILINMSGVTWFDPFTDIPAKFFIDENPAFTQIKLAKGDSWLRYLLDNHDVLFTYGCNIGQPGCSVPTAGYEWRATRQPLVMDLWPFSYTPGANAFTTVMSVRPYDPIEYEGHTYGHKDVELMRFLHLPDLTPQPLELAVDVDDQQREELVHAGWHLADPMKASGDVDQYRAYIRESRGEFSIAKNAYVQPRSGWFSDRSASYLASGKPVLLQDTGFPDWLPTGQGLLSFSTIREAADGLARINADYETHCRAARRLAEEYFDSDRVLRLLLQSTGPRTL